MANHAYVKTRRVMTQHTPEGAAKAYAAEAATCRCFRQSFVRPLPELQYD